MKFLPSCLRAQPVATGFGLTLLLVGPACFAVDPSQGAAAENPNRAYNASIPGAATQTNWKERIEQPYVYLENIGDYRGVHAKLSELCRAAVAENIEVVGPPFALFFDDPATTPVVQLYARACLPVRPGVMTRLGVDTLPRALVVYGRLAGDYRNASVGYAELFRYINERKWIASGPIRETYLTDPATVGSSSELVTEIQVPWRQPSAVPERAGFSLEPSTFSLPRTDVR